MADVCIALMNQVFDGPERKRKPDVEHHRQADDIEAGLEIAEGPAFGHRQRLRMPPARLNQIISDSVMNISLMF